MFKEDRFEIMNIKKTEVRLGLGSGHIATFQRSINKLKINGRVR